MWESCAGEETKFAFKKEYLKQGETKDRKKWESLLEELCYWWRIFESKGSKDTEVPRETEKSLLGDWHFTWISWSLVLFWSINLPVEHVLLALLKGVLKEWNQDCLLYSLKNILQPPSPITWVVACSWSPYLLGAAQEESLGWLNSSGTSILLPDCCFLGWDTTARGDRVQSSFKGGRDQRSLGNRNGNELICLVGQKGTGCLLVVPCYFLWLSKVIRTWAQTTGSFILLIIFCLTRST